VGVGGTLKQLDAVQVLERLLVSVGEQLLHMMDIDILRGRILVVLNTTAAQW
jgi:hypothetical protein